MHHYYYNMVSLESSSTQLSAKHGNNFSEQHGPFVCQRCRQPLAFDSSFTLSFDKKLCNELAIPITLSEGGNDGTDKESIGDKESELVRDGLSSATSAEDKCVEPAVSKGVHTLRTSSTESGNGYAVVQKARHKPPTAAERDYNALQRSAEIFDVLSGCSEVDHPLCEDCADRMLDEMDVHLRMIEDECKEYTDYLEQIQSDPAASSGNVDANNLQDYLQQLHVEESNLESKIKDLAREEINVKQQIEEEKVSLNAVKQEENKLLKEYSLCKKQLFDLEDDQRSVDNQLKYAQTQLDKLKKTNIFNATFHIWHSGQFGTINNFRLGRLPNVPVDWNEINAAWGQTVLLLHSLSKKMNLVFKRYRLIPYGNHSYIESLADKTKELPLHGYGGLRFFWDTKFDQAMIAFLDCLQQFKEEVERGDSNFCLPYRMEKGKIEDPISNTSYSIKIQFNSEEQWTKALKFMLTNLKWGLAWVSSQFANK